MRRYQPCKANYSLLLLSSTLVFSSTACVVESDGSDRRASSGTEGGTGGTPGTEIGETGGQGSGGAAQLGSGGSLGSTGGQTSVGGMLQSTGGGSGTGGSPELPGGDVHEVISSSGCGQAAFASEGEWVGQPGLHIDGQERSWAVHFPDDYDPNRAYPIVFEFHGCGSKTNNVPMENVAGADAIFVRGASIENCWHDLATGEVTNETESVDLAFFDAMLDEMKTGSCIDENRVFGVGYSSGAWLITIMACKRANTFRAVGTIAGADWVHMNDLDAPTCSEGNVAQMYISDTGDTGSNRWDNHVSAQDRLVASNGCMPDSELPVDPTPCVRFQGCGDYPVQRCITSGNGHGRQDGYAPGAFWSFFSEFLAED